MLSVESSASAVSQSSRSDGAEQRLIHVTVGNDDVISLSSLDRASLPCDLTDMKQVETQDQTESPRPASEPASSLDQQTESDEELTSVSAGDESSMTEDTHSQRSSDVRDQPSVITDAPGQSKLEHSVISSSLKNISQSEDQGLVYIVSSKFSTVHAVITAGMSCETTIVYKLMFCVPISFYFEQ